MSIALNILHRATAHATALDGAPPFNVQSAPGRVDIIGGLSSEAGGVVAHMALPRRAAVALSPRRDGQLVFSAARTIPEFSGSSDSPTPNAMVRFSADDLFPATGQALPEPQRLVTRIGPAGWWTLPFAGLFYLLAKDGHYAALSDAGLPPSNIPPMRGATIAIDSDIAMHAGQGSSTAITAALLQVISRAAQLNLSTLEKAVLIQRAESLFGPSSGHVVDALTILCALDGPPAHLLRYSAEPHNLMGQIPLPPDVRLFALNTGIPAKRSGETVLSLRLAGDMGLRIMETIYRDLGRINNPLHGYLGNTSPELYRRYFRSLLPRRLRGSDFLRSYGELSPDAGLVLPGEIYRVRAAVDHLVSEREHAENFLQAMEDLSESAPSIVGGRGGTLPGSSEGWQRRLVLQRAGRLLLASQHSYRLRLGLSCPQADWLVNRLMRAGPAAGVFGARISASGGGGTVVAMLDSSSQATDTLLQLVSDYPLEMGLPLEIQAAGAPGSAGAALSVDADHRADRRPIGD